MAPKPYQEPDSDTEPRKRDGGGSRLNTVLLTALLAVAGAIGALVISGNANNASASAKIDSIDQTVKELRETTVPRHEMEIEIANVNSALVKVQVDQSALTLRINAMELDAAKRALSR